jgi:glucose-6-phosphate isomerase, archaeal
VSEETCRFDPQIDVRLDPHDLSFHYGDGIFGPVPEMRRLDAIRPSLRDPECSGPDPVYGIAMGVGREEDRLDLNQRMLLFGVVAYAAGQLGSEPVRSQGHVHALAPHCGWSTPELFEIWQGRAIIYAQENTTDDPGRCVAIAAGPGDQVVVPPNWAHCVINAEPKQRMVFGAWCDRQYGFVYQDVRAHGGLAWFPLLTESGEIGWEKNPRYLTSSLRVSNARRYPELGLRSDLPIYRQYQENPEAVQWVAEPFRLQERWKKFEP